MANQNTQNTQTILKIIVQYSYSNQSYSHTRIYCIKTVYNYIRGGLH